MNKHSKVLEKLKELESISLSNHDIENLLDGKVNVVTYPELKEYSSLDELLGNNGCAVILYMTDKNFGHWCALVRVNNKLVEFFDPYGMVPDSELKFVPAHLKKSTRQDFAYLSQLMDDSPYKLSYNEYPMQHFGKGLNTCGRWSTARCIFKEWPLSKFHNKFVNNEFGMSPDSYVTMFTELYKELKK